jgi:hypothetical protein
MTTTEIKTVNNYFQNFVIEYQSDIYFSDKIQQKYVINIAQGKEVHFDSNWNYLMTLVEIIEQVYSVREITLQNNYCCFVLDNDCRIQDKGFTKLDAIYNCCFQVLNEYWKEEATPVVQKFVEPFDEEDLL